MRRFEDVFEVICERNQSPFAVLSKYKDDPDVLVSFANILEPRVMKESEPLSDNKQRSGRKKQFDKKTKRLGINPKSEFDTPIGIYGFPLKVYWKNWLENGRAHFAIERPLIWIYKPRNPERCARSSTYTDQDLERDFEKLREMFPEPKYDPDTILSNVSSNYKRTAFQKFWTVTRDLALMFKRTQAFPDDDGVVSTIPNGQETIRNIYLPKLQDWVAEMLLSNREITEEMVYRKAKQMIPQSRP